MITTVYMLVDGVQTPFSMEEYNRMRAEDERVCKLRFVRLDDCLYEASEELYHISRAEEQKRLRERARQSQAGAQKYKLVHYNAFSSDGAYGEECIPDPLCDVEALAILHLQIEELRKALSALSAEEYELIEAIFAKNISVREYARSKGITHPAVLYRKKEILKKLKKALDDKKTFYH